MSIGNEIRTVLENRLDGIPEVYIEKGDRYEGEKNETNIYMTSDFFEAMEDEGGDTDSGVVYMSFEIKVDGVLDIGAIDYEEIYLLADEFKLALKTIPRQKLVKHEGTYGDLETRLDKVLIDQIAKPVRLSDKLGFIVFGKVKLYQSIIEV